MEESHLPCIFFRCKSISQHLPLSVSEWVIDSFRLEIAIASPSYASLFQREIGPCRQNFYSGKHKSFKEEKLLSKNISERKCQMILEGATKWCLTNFADGTFPRKDLFNQKYLSCSHCQRYSLSKRQRYAMTNEYSKWLFCSSSKKLVSRPK